VSSAQVPDLARAAARSTRVRGTAAATVLAATLIAAGSAPAKDALPRCAWTAPQYGPRGLPATLSLETRCADFHLQPNGSLHPQPHGILYDEAPRGSIGFADGSWWSSVQERLAAHRGAVRLWRSTRRYPRLFDMQAAAVGPGSIAFAYRSQLFVASRGSGMVERPVARGERPLGWSRDGLLFTSRGLGEVRLRAADGSLVAVAEPRARAVRFDALTGTVLMIGRSGQIVRFDGRVTTPLASLRRLGMPVTSWVEPLAGGLIGLTAAHRVVVLRADGSLFGSARFPRGGRWGAAGNSGLVADQEGRAVALTMTEGNTGYAVEGAEWLLVLREGDRVARAVHRERLRFAVCERWTTLAWHDRWLLYSSTEGHAFAVDTRRRRVVDLTQLVARLPGARPNGELKVELTARWAAT
jgi:hypothetical protein